jgi:uncharacterized membrane protein
MASTVYDIKNVYTVDDFEIEISPLKIKYLREFMETFQFVKNTNTDEEATDILIANKIKGKTRNKPTPDARCKMDTTAFMGKRIVKRLRFLGLCLFLSLVLFCCIFILLPLLLLHLKPALISAHQTV